MAKVKLAQGHQTSREIPDQKLHALRRNCIMVEVEVLDEDPVALEAGTNSAEILVCETRFAHREKHHVLSFKMCSVKDGAPGHRTT